MLWEWLMTASRFLGLVATVLVSGATGWVLNEQWRTTGENAALPVAESSASSLPAPGTTPGAGPPQAQHQQVTLFGDGTVTVNVQNHPLQWLLDEIARQGGGQIPAPAPVQDPAALAAQNSPESAVGNAGSGSATGALEQKRALQTLQTLQEIREGDEKVRYESLLKASSLGLAVPHETLKSIYETDTSERVRLLAFQQYLDVTQSASLEETRATLHDALYSTSAAVQTEAQKLLDELGEPPADGKAPLPGN
jgi:hypothetical protein